MQSRTARLTLSVLAIVALAAAAFFAFQTERQLEEHRTAARRFDERVRAVDRALTNIRLGQQAYVAAGQGADAWAAKVSALSGDAAQVVDDLRAAARTSDARASLMEAAATLIEVSRVDRRIVEYLQNGDRFMAADVVFAEGGQTVELAANQLDAARALEQQGFDVAERDTRRRQMASLGGAAVVASLFLILLAAVPGGRKGTGELAPAPVNLHEADEYAVVVKSPTARQVQDDVPRHSAPTMKAAAEICMDLARVNDRADLAQLLGRTADLMDASGVVVWIGNTAGGELRPAIAHGYPPQAVARMPGVPRGADNAAAAAYRTGALQIVLARPGASSGALVAPLVTPDGCIGALTAEIRGRGETSDTTQALVQLFAAQLAAVVAPSATTDPAAVQADRLASA